MLDEVLRYVEKPSTAGEGKRSLLGLFGVGIDIGTCKRREERERGEERGREREGGRERGRKGGRERERHKIIPNENTFTCK